MSTLLSLRPKNTNPLTFSRISMTSEEVLVTNIFFTRDNAKRVAQTK